MTTPTPHVSDGIEYGHVFALYTEGTADSSVDLDPYPDERWLTGTVAFRPAFSGQSASATLRVPGIPRARGLVITDVEFPIVNSRLVDRQDREGVWLITAVDGIPVYWYATVTLKDARGRAVLSRPYLIGPDVWATDEDGARTINLPDLLPAPSALPPAGTEAVLAAQASATEASNHAKDAADSASAAAGSAGEAAAAVSAARAEWQADDAALKSELLGGAGAAFDTLQELATALGEDSDFAGTVTQELAGKVSLTDPRLSDARPPTTHSHAVADVTGLQAALDGKASTSHTHSWSSVTGKPTSFPPSAHTHTTAEVTGLDAALAGKAPSSHTHSTGQVSGLDAALAGKVSTTDPRLSDARTPTAHTHTEYAPTSHTHVISDLDTTGTPDGTKFLRDDGTWATPTDTNTTYAAMAQTEADAGTATTPRSITAAVVRGAVQRWVTGASATAVSAVGQALARAADAAAARGTIGAVADNDPRLSDARTPTAHTHTEYAPAAHSHTPASLGAVADSDPRLSDARTPTAHSHAVSDLDATGTADGLTFLRGDGTWAVPPAGGSSGPVAWADVQDKPSTFPPAAHRHDATEVDLNLSGTSSYVGTVEGWAEDVEGRLASAGGGGSASGVTVSPPDGVAMVEPAALSGSVALGYAATTDNSDGSPGENGEPRGTAAVALGLQATGSGAYSTAVGSGSAAPGLAAAAVGSAANAAGAYSLAVGNLSAVPGDFSAAIGPMVQAPRHMQIVLGVNWGPGMAHEVCVPGVLVLQSPDGSEWAVTVSDTGVLSATPHTPANVSPMG